MFTSFQNITDLKRQKTIPSSSQNQQIATSIAEHDPSKLYARNKGLLRMTKNQLHEFANTKRKGLPKSAPKRPRTKLPTL